MDDRELRETTKRTAAMLFHTVKGGTGFETWKKFDKQLARELSMFFTGKLYGREVISQTQPTSTPRSTSARVVGRSPR